MQVGKGGIDSSVVLLDNGFTALAVGLLDRFLDLGDRLILRQDTTDGKETGLHDGVDAYTHAGLFGDLICIDGVQLELLLDDLFLNLSREVVPYLARLEWRCDQQRGAFGGFSEHIVTLKEDELMNGHEVGLVDLVGGLNRAGTKAKVGNRASARLLGVIDEMALGIVRCFLADDLDRVFVGSDRTICTQTPEQSPHSIVTFDIERRIVIEAGVCNVIDDTHREMILGLVFRHLIKDDP